MSSYQGCGSSMEWNHLTDYHAHYWNESLKNHARYWKHHDILNSSAELAGSNEKSYNWFKAVQELMLCGIVPSKWLLARFLKIVNEATLHKTLQQLLTV